LKDNFQNSGKNLSVSCIFLFILVILYHVYSTKRTLILSGFFLCYSITQPLRPIVLGNRSPTRVSGISGKLTSFSSVFLASTVKTTLPQARLTHPTQKQ